MLQMVSALCLMAGPLSATTIVNDWITSGNGVWGDVGNWSQVAVPTADHLVRFGYSASTNRTTTLNFANPAGADIPGERNVGAIVLLETNTRGRFIRSNNNAGHDGTLFIHGAPYEIDGEQVVLLLANFSIADPNQPPEPGEPANDPLLTLRSGTNSITDYMLMQSGVVYGVAGSRTEFNMGAGSAVRDGPDGPVSITKLGPGELYMNSQSSSGYSGGTYIHEGTVLFGRTGSVGSGTVYLGKEGGPDVAFLRNLGGWDMNNDVIVAENLAGTATMGSNLGSSGLVMRSNGDVTLGSDLILFTDMIHATDFSSINFNGDFIGSRNLTKTGIGRVGITGENADFSGDIFIEEGILDLGFDSTVSGDAMRGTLGTGKVVNNAELAFRRVDEYELANDISGTGRIIQAAAGTTILTGNNTYTGQTIIEAGELRIAGPLEGTNSITVMMGGALSMEHDGVITAPVVMMPESAAAFRLGGAAVSRLNLAGGLTFGFVNLQIELVGQPQKDDVFVLVANHGTAGSLQGEFLHNGVALSEGDTFVVETGDYVTEFQITYAYNEGGFQNSIAVTAISEAPPPPVGDYGAWRIERFGNDTDPAGEPDAKPEGQLVANLLFFGLGLDLLADQAAGVPVTEGEGAITFTRRDPAGVRLVVEVTDSLTSGTWAELAVLEPGATDWTGAGIVTEQPAGEGVVQVSITDPAISGDLRFVRIRAELPAQ